jgi:hypothetical protein
MNFKASEIKASSLKVGVKYILGTPMGKLNEKDIVEVKSITVYGNDIQINLENQNGVKDFIILDRSDDVKLV